MSIVCGRGNLAAAFYLDKKFSNVQVDNGGKTGGFPARYFFPWILKKTDGGFGRGKGVA
jgi:hypothetical protein